MRIRGFGVGLIALAAVAAAGLLLRRRTFAVGVAGTGVRSRVVEDFYAAGL